MRSSVESEIYIVLSRRKHGFNDPKAIATRAAQSLAQRMCVKFAVCLNANVYCQMEIYMSILVYRRNICVGETHTRKL